MMPAMILCAGFGTRLRPLTNFLPKPLLPIGDRPAFRHVVDRLRRQGFGPIAVNTHHRADAFTDAVPGGVVVLYEPCILGTAGGVANASLALGPGDVLVWNGDIQVEPDLARLVHHHRHAIRTRAVAATVLAAPRPAGSGTIGIDSSGNLARLRGETFGAEHTGGDYLGVMILSAASRQTLPPEGCLVGDLLMPTLRRGDSVAVVEHAGDWVDIGTAAHYLEANRRWLREQGRSSWVAPNARIGSNVHLFDTVVAEGGVVDGTGSLRQCVVLPGGRLQAPAERCIAMPDGQVAVLQEG